MRFLWMLVVTIFVAADWRVDTEALLHDAAGQAQTGDTIIVDANIALQKPLILEDKSKVTLRSDGWRSIKYVGNDPTATAVTLQHCSQCVVEGIQISGECETGLALRNGPQRGVTTTQCLIRDVRIAGGEFNYCLFVDSRQRDENNDLHMFERVTLRRAKHAAVRLWGGNVHRLVFRDCIISNSPIGVWAENGCYFAWRDGQGSGCDTDFLLGDGAQQMVIDGFRTELGKQFVKAYPSKAPFQVAIRNVLWTGRPETDSRVIDLPVGPVTFDNVLLRSDNGELLRIRTGGITSAHGLSVHYQRPRNGDTTQKPIAVDPRFPITGSPVMQYVLPANEATTIPLAHSDPSKGRRVVLEHASLDRDTVTVDWSPPLSGSLFRSHSVAFTARFDRADPNRFLQVASFSLEGLPYGVIIQHQDIGRVRVLPTRLEGTHKIAWSYDRDAWGSDGRSRILVAIDGNVREMPGANPLLPGSDPASLSIGGSRCVADIEGLSVWDRALSERELTQVTTE